MSDTRRLEILRLSIARVAQAAGVQTEKLPVLEVEEDELLRLTKEQGDGWNGLCARLIDHIECVRDAVNSYNR